jgi:hypothetical protein
MDSSPQPQKPVRIEYVPEGTIAAIKAANRRAAELLSQEEKENFGLLGITSDARLIPRMGIADWKESNRRS